MTSLPVKVTETDALVIYETDDEVPPFHSLWPSSRYVIIDGVPYITPRDTRMVTTRGELRKLEKSLP